MIFGAKEFVRLTPTNDDKPKSAKIMPFGAGSDYSRLLKEVCKLPLRTAFLCCFNLSAGLNALVRLTHNKTEVKKLKNKKITDKALTENPQKLIDEVPFEISVSVPVSDLPDTPQELINTYGTYEVQATADTKNQYPAIAQGFNSKIISEDCENKDRKTHISENE